MKNQATPEAGIPGTILCQAHTRPAGVSLLDKMTSDYEKQTGRKSVLPAHVQSALASSPQSGIANRFTNFLETGNHSNPYTQADARAMLDQARSLLLTRPAPLPAAPRTATATTPRPVATATPAPAPATTTALEFEGPPLKMTRTEFDKMSPAGKSKFSTSGGRIV